MENTNDDSLTFLVYLPETIDRYEGEIIDYGVFIAFRNEESSIEYYSPDENIIDAERVSLFKSIDSIEPFKKVRYKLLKSYLFDPNNRKGYKNRNYQPKDIEFICVYCQVSKNTDFLVNVTYTKETNLTGFEEFKPFQDEKSNCILININLHFNSKERTDVKCKYLKSIYYQYDLQSMYYTDNFVERIKTELKQQWKKTFEIPSGKLMGCQTNDKISDNQITIPNRFYPSFQIQINRTQSQLEQGGDIETKKKDNYLVFLKKLFINSNIRILILILIFLLALPIYKSL